jgi:hypothetical protein
MNTTSTPAAGNRRTLYLIALVCLAPLVASYAAYFFFPRDAHTNYGTLLAIESAPAVQATDMGGKPATLADVKGRWVIVVQAGGACAAVCSERLYATRQARTMQGRERERVQRVWLITDDEAPSATVLAEHADALVWRVASAPAWPAGADAIYLVDPIGNQVLAWPAQPDIKQLARDIEKLLRASRIG